MLEEEPKKVKRFYFAYGSNMNPEQMEFRCPGARSLGGFKLNDWRLVFRMVADIEPCPGAQVVGVLWEITEEHERALDAFEGVEAETYYKDYFGVETPEGPADVLVYVMNSDGIYPPTERYYTKIVEGYRAHGLKFKTLREAKDRAHDEKAPSFRERRRYAAAGRPRLAMRSDYAAVPLTPRPEREPAPQIKPAVTETAADDFGFPQHELPSRPRAAKRMNLSDWLADKRNRS